MTNKTATKQTRKTAGKTKENPAVEGTAKLREGIETAAAFNQANVEALVASSAIAAKAFENMTSELAAYTKKSYEDGMAAAKALGSCRDVSELVEKQAEFQRSSIESFVNEATKLNELYAAAAKDAFEPIGQRFTAGVDIVKDNRF